MPSIKIYPSLLSADFGNLQAEIDRLEPLVEGFHFDVMDGHFVPNLSMGAPILKKIHTEKVFDVHLMVTNPQERIQEFAKAGAYSISFHIEATTNSKKLIQDIRDLKVKPGVVIKPKTPLESILEVLDLLDFVLVMSVEPGFGGQSFMPEVLPKVQELRRLKPEMDIEIDGGVSDHTAPQILKAGANVLISGSYIFQAHNAKEAIAKLK